jgi:hypothetical protein
MSIAMSPNADMSPALNRRVAVILRRAAGGATLDELLEHKPLAWQVAMA